MISKATLRYIRISPRKVRPVIALIKGKKAEDAISTLYSVKKKASAILIAIIDSAMANARRVPGIDVSNLYISSLIANGGPQLKRFRAASMGRASTIRKRTSHITVELDTLSGKETRPVVEIAADESKKIKNTNIPVKADSKERQAVKKLRAKESTKSEHVKKGKE